MRLAAVSASLLACTSVAFSPEEAILRLTGEPQRPACLTVVRGTGRIFVYPRRVWPPGFTYYLIEQHPNFGWVVMAEGGEGDPEGWGAAISNMPLPRDEGAVVVGIDLTGRANTARIFLGERTVDVPVEGGCFVGPPGKADGVTLLQDSLPILTLRWDGNRMLQE